MLVLDANILIRAVLDSGPLHIIRKYAGQVEFVVPEAMLWEAHRRLPGILERRGKPVTPAMLTLNSLVHLVGVTELGTYAPFEAIARAHLARRDEDDWPVLAAALALRSPIWTEDTDFFGCGVATWTSDRVELCLSEFVHENPNDQ